MMKNNKGFTLVELLAVVAILGIIMAVTIPNILGFLDRNERTTYIEDAKKMIAVAESEYRSNTSLSGNVILLRLSDLDSVDVIDGPKGNPYDVNNSYVILYDEPGGVVEYQYFVSLFETDGEIHSGLPLVHRDVLYAGDAITYVEMNLDINYQDISVSSSVNGLKTDGELVRIEVAGFNYLKGDCNMDGTINALDVTLVNNVSVGNETNSLIVEQVRRVCDMNNDGIITDNDRVAVYDIMMNG